MERLLTKLDEFPAGALIRLAVGYAIQPIGKFLAAPAETAWWILPWFVAALVTMRVLPLLLRKVVSFPPGAAEVWADRRQLAKRFDSYQWRKLLWVGIGMAAYAATAWRFDYWAIALTAACLVAGLLGEWAWRLKGRQDVERAS